ncbi:MAG: Gfo/Idh/MocA family oxidoreductase [Bryobacteraceae bacterium]
MSRLRGGIVGCGFFAQFHLDGWRRMNGVDLAAACDPDLDRAREAAPNAYASVEEMLDREQLDFIDIATRPETHLEFVRRAVDKRIPVICQKPMAMTMADARTMAEEAAAAGVPFMIHENWRWQPWYRVLRERIAAGGIGAVVTYRFRMRRADGMGAEPYAAQPYFRQMPRLLLFESVVHPIDTARFLFGGVDTIYAHTARRNPRIAGEDTALCVLQHKDSGLAGIVDGHRFTDLRPDSPPLGDTSVEGELGILEVTPAGDVLSNGKLVWPNTYKHGYRGDSVRATQQHFVDCLRTGQEFETSGQAYLHTFAAVEAAYRSASEGKAVAVADVEHG